MCALTGLKGPVFPGRVQLFLSSSLAGSHLCSDLHAVSESVPHFTHPNSSPTGYRRASPTSQSMLPQLKDESGIGRLLLTEGLGTPMNEAADA